MHHTSYSSKGILEVLVQHELNLSSTEELLHLDQALRLSPFWIANTLVNQSFVVKCIVIHVCTVMPFISLKTYGFVLSLKANWQAHLAA